MREKLKIRRDRKTQNMKFFRQSLLKSGEFKKEGLKEVEQIIIFAIFLEKKKQEREHTKEYF